MKPSLKEKLVFFTFPIIPSANYLILSIFLMMKQNYKTCFKVLNFKMSKIYLEKLQKELPSKEFKIIFRFTVIKMQLFSLVNRLVMGLGNQKPETREAGPLCHPSLPLKQENPNFLKSPRQNSLSG